MELVAEKDGVRFVNDSKATNVVSALRSLESFESGVVPIIGGRFKGGDLRLLREPLRQRAKAVVAIGEARPLLRAALADVVDVHEADSLEAAVQTRVCARAAERGGSVGPGLRELRHVSGLRGTGTALQGRGEAPDWKWLWLMAG